MRVGCAVRAVQCGSAELRDCEAASDGLEVVSAIKRERSEKKKRGRDFLNMGFSELVKKISCRYLHSHRFVRKLIPVERSSTVESCSASLYNLIILIITGCRFIVECNS